MLNNNVRLAWQFYQQEKRYAHQRFLSLTQIVLMVFIVTLSQTSDTIQRYLTHNLNNLLGADLVVSQKGALKDTQQAALIGMTEQLVLTRSLNTTLMHNDVWQRVKLKGVGKGYPLQGELLTSTALAGELEATSSGPNTGEVWLDSRLLASLSLQLGEQITIADQKLTFTRILQHEPDRLMEGHNVDMRAMINSLDLERLNFPQDIIHHRYLFAADANQISNVIDWQKDNLPAAQINHKQGAHPLALFWQRTENFIGLASIILFFMAAIAIQQLTHVQMKKEQFFSAVCLSLGSSKSTGLQISIIKWALGILFLFPVVLLISALCHWFIIQWLGSTFTGLAWSWNIPLAAKTLLATACIFFVFHFPVWLGLKKSSVAQLIHNTNRKVSSVLSLGCALLVLAGIAAAYSDNGLLTAMVLGSMGISIVLILLISWVALSAGEALTKNVSGLVPFTLFMMKQRLLTKTTQILGVGLCAFLLLFTLMLLRDLGGSMANYQRQHDGNLLVSQASEEQMDDIESWTKSHDIEVRQSKPFMYAKLTQVNGTHLSNYSEKPSDSLATFGRPIRLHWTDTLPGNNSVVDGQFWQPNDENWQQVSMEQEVMTDLGLKLGDKLTFFIADHSVEFVIAASHAYKPGAGSITFWVQMPPSALKHIDAPQYSMASLELGSEQFSLLNQLWQKHPSLRMVSLKEITQRFDNTLAMVTQVISGFSLLIIVLASIVIVSSIHALEGNEKKKNSVIMSFGFSKKTCLQLNLIEWLVTGSIAASGAIFGTWIAGLLIYQSQFSMSYQPDFIWLLGTLTIILSAVTLLGFVASKKSLSSSIRELMAE